jgi:YggT family protein
LVYGATARVAVGISSSRVWGDITPVIWLELFFFMNEIFLGQQGLLTMKMKYGI